MTRDKKTLRIAVDAMGGDYAPGEVIKGVVSAAKEPGMEIILVGPLDTLQTDLAKYDASQLPIECVNADEFVKEGEPPALVLRQKRNASIIVATKLVKNGDADAVVSAGPTGAVVASALTILGNAEGMERPVVGGPMLGFSPNTVIMDFGGNVDCKPYHLLSFAVVGCAYAQKLLNIPNPTVALLSVGSEEGKGNELVKESWPLFKRSGLNFIGNVEGNDIVAGKANVVVCDGFVGNVMLKFLEGLGVAMAKWFKTNLSGKLPDSELNKLKADLLARTVGADIIGGAPLLGVNGVAMIMHGRSQALQFARAIGQAKVVVESGLVDAVNSELRRIGEKLAGKES
jgi:glycerol-3-phosphate acyltransferase PlsX